MNAVRDVFFRALALFLAWWAFTEGDNSGLLPGLIITALVTFASVRLFPLSHYHIHPVAAVRFALHFLLRSAAAGIDVAGRLLTPRLDVNPGYRTFTTTLPEHGPRWLLANTLSLMPGTLTAGLKGNRLRLHCLDTGMVTEADFRRTEARVAAMLRGRDGSGEH